MPQPMLAHNSEYYKIISEALSSYGYSSMSDFFAEEYKDYFQDAEWRQLLAVGNENPSGKFTQTIGGRRIPILATITADDGDAPLMGTRGAELQTLEMFKTKLAYTYNEKSVEEAAMLLQNGARSFNRRAIFDNFVLDNAILIDSINVARSYAAFQMESTGKLATTATNKAGGMVGINIDYQVPVANKVKAGFNNAPKIAWTDLTGLGTTGVADPLQDLVDLFKRSKLSREGSVIRMNEDTWVTILEHPATKERLAYYVTGYLVPSANVSSFIVLEDQLKAYMEKGLRLPRVEIVSYVAATQAIDVNTQEIAYNDLKAFNDNTVLIRPSGLIGFYDWKRITNIFSTVSNPMYYAENGMTAVQQLNYTAEKAAKIVAEASGAPNPYDVSKWFYLTTNAATV